MDLAMYEKYKGKVIYINLNNYYYVVYNDGGDEIAKEAIRLFVKNDIDINMPIFTYKTSLDMIRNDIDVEEIVQRGEKTAGMISWI